MRNAFVWVSWNTFLALIPVALAYTVAWIGRLSRRGLVLNILLAILALAWLAFLPNTCYLLTEWRHFLRTLDTSDLYLQSRLDSRMTLRLMTYTAFYFFYSGIGMLAFTLAIRPVARLWKADGVALWVSAVPLFIMLSIGVYLGLVLRYNTWDLVTRPGTVWASVMALTGRPRLLTFLVVFAIFLWLAYAAIDIWIDGLIARLARKR